MRATGLTQTGQSEGGPGLRETQNLTERSAGAEPPERDDMAALARPAERDDQAADLVVGDLRHAPGK
jgi:hypothetical protein